MAPRPLAGVPTHTNALDFLRGLRPHRRQGGLRRGRVRRLRGAGRAARQPTGRRRHRVDGGQRLPRARGSRSTARRSSRPRASARPAALHPVQREMAVRGGSQCGYCTPGFVCSMAAEFYRADRSATSDARTAADQPSTGPNGFDLHALSGNLCRCTGYRPIRDAAYALGAPDGRRPARGPARRAATGGPRPPGCSTGGASSSAPPTSPRRSACWPSDPDATARRRLHRLGRRGQPPRRAAPPLVGRDRPAARAARAAPSATTRSEIGAALTLTEVERRLDGRVPLLDQLFPQFASRLIRNGATHRRQPRHRLADRRRSRRRCSPSTRRLVLARPGGRARGRRSPTTSPATAQTRAPHRRADRARSGSRCRWRRLTAFHKIAKRRFDDISSVAVGLRPRRHATASSRQARIGLGGVAATPIRARATEAALIGRPWTSRDRARGRRRAGAGGHADRRPPGQRGVPLGDARPGAAASCSSDRSTASPRDRAGPVTRACARRPATPSSASAAAARERRPARHRPRALHRRPGRAAPADVPARLARAVAPRPRAGHRARHRAGAARCPAWSGCSPPTTCPASTTRASSTTSRCSPPR